MAERETMVTADPDDTAPRIEHAVRRAYPADHGSLMAGETETDVHASRRGADLQAAWNRRNGATVEISTRTWTPSEWRRVDPPEPVAEPPAAEKEPERRCPRCGSPEWASVSLNQGYTRRAQCVPCGEIHPGSIGPGWRAS